MEDWQLNEAKKEQVMAHLLAGLQAQVRGFCVPTLCLDSVVSLFIFPHYAWTA